MVFLAHCVDVGLIPEQGRVAAVRCLVVSYRAVACRVSPYADGAGHLAGVCVSGPDTFAHLLPALGAVPCTPLYLLVTLPKPRLLVSCRSAYQWLDGGDEWAESFELGHDVLTIGR